MSYVPHVAIFLAGVATAALTRLRPEPGAVNPAAFEDLKNSVADLETRLQSRESVNAARLDPVNQIRQLSQGRGVDVALELIGLPLTMHQAVLSLAVKGRAALAGIT